MRFAHLMFWPVLAGTSGVVGGIWMQRSLRAALPGALLAWTWIYSIGYPPLGWNLASDLWIRLLALAALGLLSGRLSGRRQRKLVDVPLDRRIVFALGTGFAVRGVIAVLLNLRA
jgi:hypothetical protein